MTGSDVRMFRGDPARTGVMPSAGPAVEPNLRWHYGMMAAASSTPAVVAGVAYFGDERGVVCALDLASPGPRWEFETRGPVSGSPAVVDNVVYAGSRDGHLYAIDAATGRERWRWNAGSPIWSSPLALDSEVIVAAFDGRIAAIETRSGVQRWATQLSGVRITSSPAAADGMLFIGAHRATGEGGLLLAVHVPTGAEMGAFPLGGGVRSTPAIAGGAVFVGCDDHHVYAVDLATAALRWRYATGGPPPASPTVAGGLVYIGSEDGAVHAIDAGSGAARWRQVTGGRVTMPVALAGDTVYVAGADEHVYALDAVTGGERWRFRTTGAPAAAPVVADGAIYLLTVPASFSAIGRPMASANAPRPTWGVPVSEAAGAAVDPPRPAWGVQTASDPAPQPAPYPAAAMLDTGALVAGLLAETEAAVTAANQRQTSAPLSTWKQAGYRGRPDRSGESPGPAPIGPLSLRWLFKTGDDVKSSPTVVDGTVFVGSNDDHLYAIDAESGDERWRFKTGNDVRSSPAIADGKVFFGSNDDFLYMLDTATGTNGWRFRTRGNVGSSPIVVDGTVYVGSEDGHLYAVDVATGHERWRCNVGSKIQASPAVAGGLVIVGSRKQMHAVQASTGRIRWEFRESENDSWAFSTPAVHGDQVATFREGNQLYVLDVKSGRAVRKGKLANVMAFTSDTSPAFVDGIILVRIGEDLLGIDVESWSTIWKTPTWFKYNNKSLPTVVSGEVWCVGKAEYPVNTGKTERKESILRIDVRTGEILSATPADFSSNCESSPTVVGGAVYFGADNGYVYAYGGR